MSQEKAQLIAPQGTFTVPGINVAGVVTGGNFVGNVTGAASSIVKGSNLIVGVLTASSFVGDVTGNVTGITSSTDNLILGEVTATSMTGDFTGIASGLTGGPNIVAGLVTATKFQGNTPGSSTGVSGGKNINVGTFTASSFAGDLTGNAARLSTNNANLKLGITSATSFAGDLTGNASELAGSSANLKLGITSASSFAGDLTGNAANLAGSSARLKLGIVTATSFAGNLTGNAANLTGTNANLNLGIVTASSFAGNLTGNVASLSTNDSNMRLGIVTASSFAGNLLGNAGSIASNNKNLKLGICSASSFSGDLTGNASAVSGTPNLKLGICTASSFAGNLTGNAAGLTNNTSHANLGIVTASSLVGDGSNLTGIAAAPFSQQAVTANSSSTTINVSNGNVIYMTQSANTTIAFSNISDNVAVLYLIRIKDDTSTERTITWPSGFVWDGGSEPTLLQKAGGATYKSQTFKLITRDNGTTWYASEVSNFDTVLPRQIWMWGFNESGQLGVNDKTDRSSPVQVPGTTWSVKGDMGNKWAHNIKSDATLWAWGSNSYGVLGQNNTTSYSSPKQIPGTTWATVNSGQMDVVMSKTDGTLWVLGRNGNGSLGVNAPASTYASSPTQVPGTTWSSTYFTSNSYHGVKLAVKTDGTLWTWGQNNYGQLAQNDRTVRSQPIQIGTDTTWKRPAETRARSTGCIKTDGTLWMWGRASYGTHGDNTDQTSRSSPVQVPGTTWTNLACGTYQSVATKSDGTLWIWGDNRNGGLGQNQPNNSHRSSPVQIPGTNWDDINAGQHFVAATKTDGTLWTWGENDGGQLGHNDIIDYSSPNQIPGTDWAAACRFGFYNLKPGVMGFKKI